jgi:hypothetical protein
MPSAVYQLFQQAMAERKQVICTYQGYRRELCPVILGHSDGVEKALTFQFAGQSSKRLPPGGSWKCMFLAEVGYATLRDGPWHSGKSHRSDQSCVKEVDYDVNPDSPFNPRFKL